MTVATLPISAHIGIVRKHIEAERFTRMRLRSNDAGRARIKDSDTALASLKEIEVYCRGEKNEKP